MPKIQIKNIYTNEDLFHILFIQSTTYFTTKIVVLLTLLKKQIYNIKDTPVVKRYQNINMRIICTYLSGIFCLLQTISILCSPAAETFHSIT